MHNLPEEFMSRMKSILGDEYIDFISSYDKVPYRGVRLNPLKCNIETLRKSLPFEIKQAPFSELSFYAETDISFGKLPAHHAGMFYSQEPSAASAVSILAPESTDKVLDLCAAPGGKSTQIASYLSEDGLLWSNEIIKSRANILLSNIERMGVKNAIVSSCHPEKLCNKLEGYFDKVLVDAPCSGEGMFKKEEAAIRDWSIENVKTCATRQLSILDSASKALKENGILVYSTCTFSLEENENVVKSFLQVHDDFELIPIKANFGRPAFEIPALRIFPMDGGEGHFVAKFRKKSLGTGNISSHIYKMSSDELKIVNEFWKSTFNDSFNVISDRLTKNGNNVILLPKEMPSIDGLGVIRAGVQVGEIRGKRLESSHALFMSRQLCDCKNTIDFNTDSSELASFLHGEEIESTEKGYTAVAVNAVVTGFGKSSNGKLKNKYPKGLRTL